ncbi:WXG100-like domain-containing protein [Streptomyces cadmiisoli]|uniref:WXG100-like domain-containing protein n=1 Tax=Streptomyces cadmiisoli TaxID=2184053 RepID=UPI003664E6C6
MSIKASPEVNAMIFILTGERLIDADEDLAFDSRLAYSGLGRKIDRLSSLIDKSVHDIADSMPDDLSKAYAKAMGMLIDDGGKNFLREFAEQLDKIAEGRRKTSMDIMESKWQVIAEVIRLLIEIAIYLALSFFTGGATASQIMMAKLRSRFLILTTLSHLLQRLHLAPSLTEAFAEAFTTFAVRLAMMNFAPEGRRPDGFDWNDILKSAAFGAAAGFFTSIFDDFAKRIVKSYDNNYLKNGPDLEFKNNPGWRNTPDPEFRNNTPNPKPNPDPTPNPQRDNTPSNRPSPNPHPDNTPLTFRNNPLSFRNNPNLWRNNQLLRNNADRPGALAGHYGLKGTADFLAAGSGEALAEILIKGAFDGDWSTSWSTFVGAGISSQVEATLTDTALNSGAELRHAIDKLRNQPATVSGDTGDSDTRDSGGSSRAEGGDGSDRTDGTPRTDSAAGEGSVPDSPPPYAAGNPPPYSPGTLPMSAAEIELWQQVHNGSAEVREQALRDLAALRGDQPGSTEIGVRDSLHGNLSQLPEIRVVPAGNSPTVQIDTDEVRRALDGFGTPITVDTPITTGQAETDDLTTTAPGQAAGSPVTSSGPDPSATGRPSPSPAAGPNSSATPGTSTAARPGGIPIAGATPTPSTASPQGNARTEADTDTGARTGTTSETAVSPEIVALSETGTTPETMSSPESPNSAGTTVASVPGGDVPTTADDTTADPPKVSTIGSYTDGGAAGDTDGALDTGDMRGSGGVRDVKAGPTPAGNPLPTQAPPLTIVVSAGPPPGEGSPEADELLDGAGTDRAVVLGPAVTPDGAGRPVRAAIELTREGPGAPVRVRTLSGPAATTDTADATSTTVAVDPANASFPGADVLLPLADALGPAPAPAPRPATQSASKADVDPVVTTRAPLPKSLEETPAEPSAEPAPPAPGNGVDPGPTATTVPAAAKLATLSRPWTEPATDLYLESGTGGGGDTRVPGPGGRRGPGNGGTPPPATTDHAPATPPAAPSPPVRIVVRPADTADGNGPARPVGEPVVTTLDGHTVPLAQLRRWMPDAAVKPPPGRAVRTLTISQSPAEDGTAHSSGRRALLGQDTFRGVRTTSTPQDPQTATVPRAPRTVFTGPPTALPGSGTEQGADYFAGHGTSRTVTLGTDDAAHPTVKVSGVQLGEVLKSWTRDGDQNRPLVLFSCETGRQPEVAGLPVAQHVANRTGRPVYAPTTEVGTARDRDGHVRAVLTEGADGPGRWRLFTPEPSGTALDDLAREAGLHTGPEPADPFTRARTLQQIRTLREALGPDAEQRPENRELLAGLAYVDGLRWLGADTAARYGDGRMTPDLLRRMVVDRRAATVTTTSDPTAEPTTDPTAEQYTEFLRAAAELRTTAGPGTTLDALLPPPPPTLPPTTLVSPEDVHGLSYAPSAQITWSLSSTPLPLSELALSPEDAAELARRRPDLAPPPSRPESIAEELTVFSKAPNPAGPAVVVRADGLTFNQLTTPGGGNCLFRALLDAAGGQTTAEQPAWVGGDVAGLRALVRDRITAEDLRTVVNDLIPDPVFTVVDDLRMQALAGERDPHEQRRITDEWNSVAQAVVTDGDAERWRQILRNSQYSELAVVAPTPADARRLGGGLLLAAAAERSELWSSPIADLLPEALAHALHLDLRLVRPDPHAPDGFLVTTLNPGGQGGTLHLAYNGTDHYDALIPASAVPAPAATVSQGKDGSDLSGALVPLETQLDRHRPARLLTGEEAPPPGPAPNGVTFQDGSRLPVVLINPDADPGDGTPGGRADGAPHSTPTGLLTGPGVLTLRSPEQVAREILGRLPQKLRAQFDEAELLRLLTDQPAAFTAPRGARLVGREKSGVGHEMTVEAIPYHRWERFSDVHGGTVRLDTMRRGQAGTGGGRSVGHGRRIAAALSMGPPLSWLLKIGVSLGWTRRTDYTLGTQAFHQSEYRAVEGSHLHLDDVFYRVRVERVTEAPKTTGQGNAARADAADPAGSPTPGPRWLRGTVHTSEFAVRDGLSWRLPDDFTVSFTGPRRAPQTLTFPDGVEPRVTDITGLHLTDAPEDVALAVSEARPGSSAHRTLVSYVRPGRLLALFGRLSGPVSGPELTRGSGRHPLGHLIVERSVAHRGTLVNESVKAELRELTQTTYQNQRGHVRDTNFGIQVTSGPNHTLVGPETDVRLQGGPLVRADLSSGRGHYLGTDAARKTTGRVRNHPVALYRVERTLMVRRAGEPASAARPIRVVTLDWMSTQDARELAGWDSRTPGRTGPNPDAEPPVPWYLTRADPVHLSGQVRAEGFRPLPRNQAQQQPAAQAQPPAQQPAAQVQPPAQQGQDGQPAPQDPMRAFADAVLETLHRSYPSLFVPPLMLRHPRLAKFWYGDGRIRTALHNDRQVREALNRTTLAQSLDDLTTTGVPVTLTEDGKVRRGHHTLILRARLTDRRFETTMSERSLRNAVIGTELSGQGQQASSTLSGGVELGISPRDHDTVPGAGGPRQTGNVAVGARYARTNQKATRNTVAVVHDHLTYQNNADLYSYQVELGATFEGHRRPRGWTRLVSVGVLGAGLFVSKVEERPLFRGGSETVGRVELAVPAAHGSDRHAPADAPPGGPTPEPEPEVLSAEEADQLLDGTRPSSSTDSAPDSTSPSSNTDSAPDDTRPSPTADSDDGQLTKRLLSAPHAVLSTEGGRQRQQLMQDTADRASDTSWHVSAPGAPIRTALRRTMANLGVAGQLGQYLGPFGSRITGLIGAGPFQTHYLKAAVRGELRNLRVMSDPKPASLEATLGNEHRVLGSASTTSRTTLGLQGADMPLQQAPGRQAVSGSYSAALQYAWGTGRSISQTLTRGRNTTLTFAGRMYLVVADVAETIAVRDRWTAAMGAMGTRAGTGISSAAGRLSERLGRGLAPRRAAAALHRIRDAVMFHLPMQDAIGAGLAPDGLGTETPRNLGDGYQVPDFLRDRRFPSHPSGQLDASDAAQKLRAHLEAHGVPSHDREQILQRLSPDFLRAHLHELTTDGMSLPIRHRTWYSPHHVPVGGSTGQVRFRLTPVTTTVERLRTGFELEDYRNTSRDDAIVASQDRGGDVTLGTGQRMSDGALAANPSLQGTAARQRSNVRTETTGRISMPVIATTQVHAEIVTSYRLTVTVTDATGEPLFPQVVSDVGTLNEILPASLLTPKGKGADGTLTEQKMPQPSPGVALLTAAQARPEGIAAWRTSAADDGSPDPDVLTFDDRIGSGILAVDIRGAAGVQDALTLATARADGLGDGDLGKRHTEELAAQVRKARRTPLTGLGTAPAQAQSEATSQGGLTAGFREALGANGSPLPTQSSARLFGQSHTADSRLYARMHRSGARLLAVESKPRMEAMQRAKTSDALDIGITDNVEAAVGTSPLAGTSKAGVINPGATVPIGGANDTTALKATVDTTLGTHLKVVTDRSMLFALPVSWLAVAEVDHRITDGRPLRALGKAKRGPRAAQAETTALVWLREDIARDYGLLDDTTFPTEVRTAWDAMAKAAADLATAEKRYYDARARARETWLNLSAEEQAALGDDRPDLATVLPQDTARSSAVAAWQAAREEVRRWERHTDAAAADHHRLHLAATRLTAHSQGRPSNPLGDPPQEYTEPTWRSEAPQPYRITSATGSTPRTLSSPDDTTVREVHDMPHDGASFFHALLAVAQHRPGLTHLMEPDLAARFTTAPGNEKVTAEAIDAVRGSLARALLHDRNEDLLDALALDAADTFTKEELVCAGVELTPEQQAEFEAFGRLPQTFWPSPAQRVALAGIALARPFASEPRQDGTAADPSSPAPPERRAGDHGGADLLPALAARVLGTPLTVVTGQGHEQIFLPHGGDPATVDRAADPVLFAADGFFHAALPPGTPPPVATPLRPPTTTSDTGSKGREGSDGTDAGTSGTATLPLVSRQETTRHAARRSHAAPPWFPPTDSGVPRYRLAGDGVLTAPDGATYTQGAHTGRGNGFFGSLSTALRHAAEQPGLESRTASRLRLRAGTSPTQLMRLNGLPGAPAQRDSLFTPPPLPRRPGAPAPSREARDIHLRRHLSAAPWGPEADRAMAEWAAAATGVTVTLIEENGTAHTYPGPSGDTGPHLRLRRRGSDFVPLILRRPAPEPKTPPTKDTAEQKPAPPPRTNEQQATESLLDAPVDTALPVPTVAQQNPVAVPLPPSPASPTGSALPGLPGEEEAYELSTLSGAGTTMDTGSDSDVEMDLVSDTEGDHADVPTDPEEEFAAEFARLLSELEPRADALLDVVRRRNARLGGFPDTAFDGAFTEHAGIGLPEALDQAERDNRLQPDDYEALREALGLGTGGPFTQTRPTGTSQRDREVTLRMLDRVARLVKEALRKPDRAADAQVTPHIAVGLLPDGSLGIAGNTGTKALTPAEADLVREELAWFVSGQEPGGTRRQQELEKWSRDEESHRQWSAHLAERQRELEHRSEEQAELHTRLNEQYESGVWNNRFQQQWDALLLDETAADQDWHSLAQEQRQWQSDERWLANRRPGVARELRDHTKLRALATGWYRLYHPDSPELEVVQRALANPRILNVAGQDGNLTAAPYGSEHGELTLLGHWVAHWENHPGDPNAPQTLQLGGFKMACAACDLAYQAVNQHLGSTLGYRVEASGTHGIFFPGWRMPQWMRLRPALSDHISDNAESIGAYLDENAVLRGETTPNENAQYPDTSSSEYESGEEELDTDDMADSSASATGAVGPRLPQPAPAEPSPEAETDSGTATPEPQDAEPPKPVLKGPRDTRPRFVVRSGFDARRFIYDGKPVTDLTVRIAIRGPEGDAARVRQQLDAGVMQFLNDPGHRLPNGDRLHVTVEHVALSDSPHLTVDLADRDRAMDQNTWWTDADPVELVHELTHQLGLRDEYRDTTSPHRPHIPGSLLGALHDNPEDPTLTPAGLRERHLALLATLIGDLTPTPQHSQTWDTARTTTTPVTRRSLWIDPISLPQPTDNTTTEIPARTRQDPDTTPTTTPEPTLTPFKSGNFEFTNLNHTNEKYRDKAVRIIDLLRRHDTIRDYIGTRPCRITLHLRTTETPADVTDLLQDGVQINLASYYFEKYDIGYIMGMLAHEIGLHPLATRNSEILDEEAMFQDTPLAVPGLSDLQDPRFMNTTGAGQADHIMAAYTSSSRHRIYRDIVLDMAHTLAEDAQSHEEGAKAQDVTDLIDCYLMDLATIAVSNDRRKDAAWEPNYTAKVYNAYKELFAARLAQNSPVRSLLPSDKSWYNVTRNFVGLGSSLVFKNRGDSIQRPTSQQQTSGSTGEARPRLPQPDTASVAHTPPPGEPRPRRPRDRRPRYVVRSGFDARRFTYAGEPVTDLTVRVAIRGTDAQATQTFDKLETGVFAHLNDPGHRLPNGDRLHVTVEHVALSDSPHLTVDLADRDRAMDQNTWWTDADPVELVHELTHQLGLRDEYRDTTSPHRPHIPGSLLGALHDNPEDPTLTPAGLRERHLALLATLIGDLTPTPQHSQTWDTARTTTTPVTRRSLWIDPISLPQPTDNTTTEIPARTRQDPDTTPTTTPEPTLTPFKSGNFEFTNLNHTNTTYRDKAVRIIELLGEHPTIRDYIGRRPCRITLHVRTRETPADVRDLDADGVQINLASYYFEKYDIGFVMGMLAHEIGLHPLASRNTDITVEERGLEDMPLPVPGLLNLSTPRTMSTEGAGQADHIMAAFPSTTRHQIYRRIVVEMAEVLAREARSGAGSTKLADVTDLFDCYLMDLASIAVTNDHRMSAAAEPGYTARVYNAYKDLLHAELSAAPALRALLPSNKSMFGVINDFRRIGTYIAINNRGDSIQSVPTA